MGGALPALAELSRHGEATGPQRPLQPKAAIDGLPLLPGGETLVPGPLTPLGR